MACRRVKFHWELLEGVSDTDGEGAAAEMRLGWIWSALDSMSGGAMGAGIGTVGGLYA